MPTTLRNLITDQQEEFSFCRRHGYQAVVFDWDGVLVDSGVNYYRAYELVLRDAGIAVSPREIYLREGQPTPEVLKAVCKEHGRVATAAEIAMWVERRRDYDIALGKRVFFPGAWELVQRLRRAGYKRGMVSGSSRKSVERALTRDREGWFDVVITADDAVRPKPDPEPFLLAAKALQLSPATCLVIENAPFGIRAARAAGCGVIGICTTLSQEDLQEANWVVQNHRELEILLSGQPG